MVVSADITNTGNRPGTEIVQLYVRDPYASITRPVHELAGFSRVDLEPGQTATVDFTLPVSLLAFLDTRMEWLVEAGDIEVLLGASSNDIRLRDQLRISRSAHIDGRTRGFFATASVRARAEEEAHA